MLSAVLALALCGQAPPAAPRNEIADLVPSPPNSRAADLVQKNRARRNSRYRAGLVQEQARQRAADYQAAADRAAYQAALPFLLEQQRQQLERLSAIERNAALQRMAAANERIAAAIQLDAVVRQNARLGYSTPALYGGLYGGTPGMLYGPYGAVIYGNPARGMQQVPVDNGNRMPVP